jgi:large subunit ribosomal protein L19
MVSRVASVFPSRLLSTFSEEELENGPFVHYRPRLGPNPKFRSPRKRASKLFLEINNELCESLKEKKPAVFETQVDVGDAVELEMINQGGAKTTLKRNIDKVRGVVIGKFNRGLGTSILIRDVIFGIPIERKIQLFSPLVKSMKVLEKNFIYKGRRKVKRAKLYFLREKNPAGKSKLQGQCHDFFPYTFFVLPL